MHGTLSHLFWPQLYDVPEAAVSRAAFTVSYSPIPVAALLVQKQYGA